MESGTYNPRKTEQVTKIEDTVSNRHTPTVGTIESSTGPSPTPGIGRTVYEVGVT